jgi:drug/metabolite transporter (DMT)-like permease
MKITLMQQQRPASWQLIIVLAIAILSVSTSAILVRWANGAMDAPSVGFSLMFAAARMGLAALLVLPGWQQVIGQLAIEQPASEQPASGRLWAGGAIAYAIAAGVALAMHFATWITSLSYTSIAASTAIVTTNPVWVALLSWLWFKEKLPRQTLIGTTVALLGGLFIGFGSSNWTSNGSNPALGNGLALVGAWAATLYILWGREAQRRGLSIGGYVAIAYSTAAVLLIPFPGFFGTAYTGYPTAVYGCILLSAFIPQLIGHTGFNWAVRWVSPTLVTLVLLLEPVLSSIFGYWIFGEMPGPFVLAGALVLLVGVAIAAFKK